MPDLPFAGFPAADPLDGSELFAISQLGRSKKITAADALGPLLPGWDSALVPLGPLAPAKAAASNLRTDWHTSIDMGGIGIAGLVQGQIVAFGARAIVRATATKGAFDLAFGNAAGGYLVNLLGHLALSGMANGDTYTLNPFGLYVMPADGDFSVSLFVLFNAGDGTSLAATAPDGVDTTLSVAWAVALPFTLGNSTNVVRVSAVLVTELGEALVTELDEELIT